MEGYDGAASISGKFNGCAAKIRELYPSAIYVYCANNNLNLAITHSCKVPAVRNCMGTMKETINLFRKSNKAGQVLKNKIRESCPSAKQTRPLTLCDTRWVERADSLSLFYEVYEQIIISLEYLDQNLVRTEIQKSASPNALLASMRTSQFIIALTVLNPIFS